MLWVVLDGMGFEHVRRALRSNLHPALSRIDREGCFAPLRPANPVCQTPPALLALFTGTQPAQNGVWGYRMPDPDRLEGSLSGFHADIGTLRTIWREMEERGAGYSLMNVAFRGDPIWKGQAQHLIFGFDGYRLWRKPSLYRLPHGTERIVYHGLQVLVRSSRRAVSLARGGTVRATLAAGEGGYVDFTKGTRVFAHLLEPATLLLNPMNIAVCRGSEVSPARRDGFLEMSAFHVARRLSSSRDPSREVSVDAELLASKVSLESKTDMMVEQARNGKARLVIGYFPVMDDFNHAYFDLLLREEDRASALFHGCMGMVDGLLTRLMTEMEDGALLVISSDHGAMAYSRMLHINEVLARAGLVRKVPGGYDFSSSSAWYHPSDCGQVVARASSDRATLLRRVKLALDEANAAGADIGVLDGDRESPFLVFLYARGETYFTGRPPRRGQPTLDNKRAGGHHLSPLSPTPWMQATLGLWSPRHGGVKGLGAVIPNENSQMKGFLMEAMGLI